MQRQTNWYVITGGPGSGKTTTVNLLKERGYITTFEHARHYPDDLKLKLSNLYTMLYSNKSMSDKYK